MTASVGLFRRLRDFAVAKDDASGRELRRQLLGFEQNVADLGAAIVARLGRLRRRAPRIVRSGDSGVALSPGDFQLCDTGAGDVTMTLTKPTPGDAGTFIVAVDIAHGANTLFLRAASGCAVNGTDHAAALSFGYLLLCDGENYWGFV